MAAFYAQGKYKATIEKWGLGESNNVNEETGIKTPCVFFVIIPQQFYDKATGEWQTVEAAYERRIDMWISAKTIDFVSRDLTKLGYPHDTFDQLDPAHAKSHNFYGQEIEVQCKHDPWTNKKGEKVQIEKWGLAFDGGGTKVPEAIDNKGVRQLNALFGKQLKEYRKKAATDKKEVADERAEANATNEKLQREAAEVI